jgi:hypothetical protein
LIDAQGALVSSYIDRLDAVAAQSARPDLQLDYQPCYAGALTGKHNGAYCDVHKCTCIKCRQPAKPNESDTPLYTLKRLSNKQLEIFSLCPAATLNLKWVTFTDADALVSELDALTGVDQRTQMKCARRVIQATGGAVDVKRRQAAPACLPCHIRIRTSEQARGVLTFIDKHLISGAVSAVTRTHTLVLKSHAADLLRVLRDMHTMKINTRSCHALISALEQAPAPATDTFNAAPLITPPAPDTFSAAPLIAADGGADLDTDDGDDDEWAEDTAFTEQYTATSQRVHDTLHAVRPAPVLSPSDMLTLPLTRAYWGDAHARAVHILNDYGYTPDAIQVTVRRSHVRGLLKQLQVTSVHGHAGRFINYEFEQALDEELAQWAGA